MIKRYIIIGIGLLLNCLTIRGQQFFNLTADEVRIDSLLPMFSHSFPLGMGFADSTYTISIVYPEFIDMSPADEARCRQLCDESLPPLPEVVQSVSVSRKQGLLTVSFLPVVFRDGHYQKLVSFMLKVKAEKRETEGKNTRRSKSHLSPLI